VFIEAKHIIVKLKNVVNDISTLVRHRLCGPLANASLAEVIASVRDKSTAMRRNNWTQFIRVYSVLYDIGQKSAY